MPSPFPGMDPYIERPAIWADFHDTLIAYVKGLLQPLLRPRYAAVTQDRLYVVESERPVRPDVAGVRAAPALGTAMQSSGILEADQPAVFERAREEVREPYLTIIEPTEGDEVVTAIEVLSPSNKRVGEGRTDYLRKRDEFWHGGTNLVEVDLLRTGAPTVRVSGRKLEALRPWTYLVATTREYPARQEVYAVTLRQRLPPVAIPLRDGDADVVLDLQTALDRVWDDSAYPALLHYDSMPPGSMVADDVAWCEQLIAGKGFR